MSVDDKISAAADRLADKVDEVKARVEAEALSAMDPSDPGFFDVVQVDVGGYAVPVYRGFVDVVKRQLARARRDVAESMNMGRKFAEDVSQV